MTAISTEQTIEIINRIPADCRNIVFSYLPKGHPLPTSQEIENAFKVLDLFNSVQFSDDELKQVKSITSRVWIQLIHYSAYLSKFTSWDQDDFPEMPILWGRFAVRFPLHFDINIRWKVQKAMAEVVSNQIISNPDFADYVEHLWFPLAALRTPIINELGVTWREVPALIESEVLDTLAEIRRDRIDLRKDNKIQCDCCQKISQLNLKTHIGSMISDGGFDGILGKRDKYAVPIEVSTIFATKILDVIDACSRQNQELLPPSDTSFVTSPDIKKFASNLEKTISKRIELLRHKLIHEGYTVTSIPVGSGDLPLLLNRLQAIVNEPDKIPKVQHNDKTTCENYVCVNIVTSDKYDSWNCHFDESWMNHNFRLKGIVDLALRLIQKGYHVKLI